MDIELLKGGLMGVVSVVAVLIYLDKFGFASRGVVLPELDGNYTMKYSDQMRYFAIFLILISIFSVIGLIKQGARTPAELWVFPLAALFIITFAYITVREIFSVTVEFGNNGIKKLSPWQREAQGLRWSDIELVTYSGNHHAFVISSSHLKIRVSRYMAGLTTFLRLLDAKVPEEHLEAVQEDLDILLRE